MQTALTTTKGHPMKLDIGDPCYLITRDAAWTIVKTAVDRVSAKGGDQ